MYRPIDDRDPAPRMMREPPRSVRSKGVLRLTVEARDGRSFRSDTYEEGALRLRLPKTVGRTLEAVMVNTGGGMAGGDRYDIAVTIGEGAAATLTGASAERIYGAISANTEIDILLTLAPQSRLAWLPLETIFFDRARLERHFTIDLAATSRLLMIEMMVLGRQARGEVMREGAFRDQWRLKRGGRLIFADAVRLDGDWQAMLSRAGTANGNGAIATLLFAAPDAGDRLATLREAIGKDDACYAGAGCRDDVLIARLIAPNHQQLVQCLARALPLFPEFTPPRNYLT
jgi:urease accessory protein